MAVTLFCGCDFFGIEGTNGRDGTDGRDGLDGKDVSIYEIYEAAKTVEGNENLTLDEFLQKYLNYTNDELNDLFGKRATINRSLLTGCSIVTKASTVAFGSGIFLWVDKDAGDAYVVTNCHVVYDEKKYTFAEEVTLFLYGQDTNGINFDVDTYNYDVDTKYAIPVEIIGASVTYDIALLKVTGSDVIKHSEIITASFTEEDDVHVGEFVYAIGNACGEGVSAAEGIISRDSENVDIKVAGSTQSYRVLRTSAAINHGNSGGGLFNAYGELVAIVNAKDDDSNVDNMGYAIPAGCVKRLLKLMYDEYVSNGYKITAGGGVHKARLNITATISDSFAVYNETTGLADIYEKVEIASVEGMPGSLNLKAGDIIKNIKIISAGGTVKEDVKIDRRHKMNDALFSVRRGDTVRVTVSRVLPLNGETIDLDVIIEFNSSSYFAYFN